MVESPKIKPPISFDVRPHDVPIYLVGSMDKDGNFPNHFIKDEDQVDLRIGSTLIQIRNVKTIGANIFEGTILGFDPMAVAFEGMKRGQNGIMFEEKHVFNIRRSKA